MHHGAAALTPTRHHQQRALSFTPHFSSKGEIINVANFPVRFRDASLSVVISHSVHLTSLAQHEVMATTVFSLFLSSG